MTQEPIYQPGDMNAMFERIVDRFGAKYEVNILSRDPWIVTFDNFVSMEESKALITATGGKWERSTDTGTANEFGTFLLLSYIIFVRRQLMLKPRHLNSPNPYHLLYLTRMFISIVVTVIGETGRILSEGRTSSNAWCQGECPKNPLVKQIVQKIEEVTGIPGVNYESFQVLKVTGIFF
jgi:hypothetical protein